MSSERNYVVNPEPVQGEAGGPAGSSAAAPGTNPPAAGPGGPQWQGGWRPETVRGRDPRRKSPLLAGLLSLMPGLGQVYVGYYRRGFAHILVFGAVMALAANEVVPALVPMLAIFIGFFLLYNVIDACRRAVLYNHALEGLENIALPSDVILPGVRGSLAVGLLLILLGAMLLSHTAFGISLSWLEDWWPLAPILFGVYLVYRWVLERRLEAGPAD